MHGEVKLLLSLWGLRGCRGEDGTASLARGVQDVGDHALGVRFVCADGTPNAAAVLWRPLPVTTH